MLLQWVNKQEIGQYIKLALSALGLHYKIACGADTKRAIVYNVTWAAE